MKKLICYNYLGAEKHWRVTDVVAGMGKEIEGHGLGFALTMFGVVSILVGTKLGFDVTAV